MRYGSYLDANGVDIFTGEDFSSESFYLDAINNGVNISVPYITADKTDAYIVLSGSIKEGNELIGVAYFYCDTYLLQSIVESFTIGETGTVYILDKEGTTIAYNEFDWVLNRANAIDDYAANPKDSSLKALAAIEQNMVNGENAVERTYYEGEKIIQAYAPISGTDGWSMAVSSTERELLSSTYLAVIVIMIICAGVVIVARIFALRMGEEMSKPIVECTDRLSLLTEGDLKSATPEIDREDEIGILSEATVTLISEFNGIIVDLSKNLSAIASGDLGQLSRQTYPGDFMEMKSSVERIHEQLRQVMIEIQNVSKGVNQNADKVADVAGSLSKNTEEQVTLVNSVVQSVTKVSKTINLINSETKEAVELSNSAKDKLQEGMTQILELVEASDEITEKSNAVINIIETINDIATQTNLLALNAAIEASRAGEAGKGFAVVADQVRDLAAKSSEAARDTGDLIAESVASTNKVIQITQRTSETLEEVLNRTEISSKHVSEIAVDISAQTVAIEQINQNMEKIGKAAQSNSEVTQDSVEMSGQMSAQANLLLDLVSHFRV